MKKRGFQIVLAGALLLSAVTALTQTSAPGSIRGRVVFPNGESITEAAMIRLESLRGVRANSYTDNQGQFRFSGLIPGIYQVIVEADRSNYEAPTTNVEVFPNSPSIVTIILKERATTATTKKGNTASTGELDTQIPAAAKKEFDLGAGLSRAGKPEEAIPHFRQAIDLYPRYLMAHNDLGTQLMALGRLDEAVAELRRAIEIDAKAFNPHLNLGIVLVQQQEFPQAIEELNKALAVEANSASGRMYLGIALAGSNDSAAERELKIAYSLGGASHALALYHLGQIYFSRGDRDAALKMFEAYLADAPNAHNAAEVRQLIALLK